jgi:hypothetical protein
MTVTHSRRQKDGERLGWLPWLFTTEAVTLWIFAMVAKCWSGEHRQPRGQCHVPGERSRSTETSKQSRASAERGRLVIIASERARPPPAWTLPATYPSVSQHIMLHKEEIPDVSLTTFHVFDQEKVGSHRPNMPAARRGAGLMISKVMVPISKNDRFSSFC